MKKITQKYKKQAREKKKQWPALLMSLVFLAGLILGGGAIFFISSNKKSLPSYYSPQVYYKPPGFVLGDKVKVFKLPILLYHYVEYNKDPKDTIRISLTINRDIFERQVQDLIKGNYQFLTVSEIGKIISGEMALPERGVALTFDDCYGDFYTDVFPILSFYNIKATIFVVSEFLNHSNNLTDRELKEIADSGLVEIGGHTVNHYALTSLGKEKAGREIIEDKKYLEKKFNLEMESFAYPYGLFDEETISLTKKAGYRQAVSVIRGTKQTEENRYFLSRIRPGNATGEYLYQILEK